MKRKFLKFTSDSRQDKPDKKAPNNPDVPRKNYDPKSLMDSLPHKKNGRIPKVL